MGPFPFLQNALLLAAVFATYWLTDSWWGVLWLVFWLSPCEPRTKEEEFELPRIVVPGRRT